MRTTKIASMTFFGCILFLACQSSIAQPKQKHSKRGSATSGTISMTCYPPPGNPIGIGPPPPCVIPVGLPDRFISPTPSGTASFSVADDGKTTFKIKVNGLAPDMVLSAWLVWYFPGLETPPDPIFLGTPPVGDLSVPLAPTSAGFVGGLGRDPNRLVTHGSSAALNVTLDYNPFLAGQGPLRNGLVFVDQSLAPADSPAYQPPCCTTSTGYDPTAAAFVRSFDPATGFQLLDENGRPQLVRSPVPAVFIAVVSHIDLQTHGVVAGIPILPIPNQPVDAGDHFLVGMFDLRAFE